jgi:hypothetical protein
VHFTAGVMYSDIIICKEDALKHGLPLNIVHQKTYMDADPSCSLLELESQNVVFIVTFPPIKEIRGMQALASTSTLSPFPDLGTRTWEGTLLTYGSGRVVCTGHKTANDAIVNINALSRMFSQELQLPLEAQHGELTNLVASGRLDTSLCREKLRQQKGARFTSKFDGTTFNAVRKKGKNMRLSVFQSGRFNVPGLRSVEEAKSALVQSYSQIIDSRRSEKFVSQSIYRVGRNTTRKRRRIRDW